jgi:hypothetical protein
MLRALSLAAAFAGLLAGLAYDARAPRPVEHRAGYRVLQGDFHLHTRFSDGVVSPCDLVLAGRRRGLDVIAVTEHNAVFPSRIARACAARLADAPIVLTGEEVTTLELHLLALGVEVDVDARASTAEVIDAVHAQGGVAIVAHPTRRFHAAAEAVCDRFDGVEVVHPLAFGARSGLGSWQDMVAFARGPCGEDKAMIGTSDYHAGNITGLLRTYVFVEDATATGVLDAIRAKRTVTVAPDGSTFGPEDLVASLQREPLAQRPTDYRYEPRGLGDRLLRLTGLAGFFGLFLFGWRLSPRRRAPERPERSSSAG